MYAGIEDKVILLVGAGGLIGREVLAHLAENKAKVVAVDLKKFDCLADLFIEANVTEKEDIEDLVNTVVETYGRIDGLVNLAYPRTSDWGKRFEEIEFESWQKNVDMQLNAVFYLCQQVLKVMKQQRYGSIVNIGSIYGVVGNDFSLYSEYGGTSPAAYTAIKGGIINFTKYLASYYGEYGIRVNCMSPGGVLDEKNQQPSFIKRYSEKSPLKRLGNPKEMAPAVTFLLSDDASFITGHNLMVDGGWTII
ncbi:SDR family oxidoreductase [Myroides marinus]|uniref:SDR family oxidoreductase n=1 Tax=Myroides marinus TaxID=703342 RepID=UPI0025768810|nr:SDR family oxidoreductase [Myroides marinus]MDM1352176.1 SDR family oxidoreductase [Myroides marinus]MDM1359385.1 SDR family oxidoreductase [Myroides marinus]MDM1366506.1 SDR family oxidoreductase [Myroides marinus]